MFPFHLLLPVRVRIDGTSSRLLPLTEGMNEEGPHIGTGDDPIEPSERLRLTAARGSDPSLSPSLFRFLSPVEVPGVRSSLI
ncbi:hypothetical protein MRB53_013852 [Persea americana]|uniref:Uncharacterized protein n=1 Tax=Persea americana TaxID=3435 RepID=A0ACC2K9C2_PERAE|nr:hypothetical protein MRB53_013852 [Persea americana]